MEKILKIKNDDYVIHQNKEYRVTEIKERWEIISKDSDSIKQGFIQLPYDDIELYCKLINVSEVESYYSLRTYAIYEGQEYDFLDGGREKYLLLLTYDLKIAQKYGLEVLNVREFGFYAPLKDITFKEIKKKKKINGIQWWSDDEPVETYITYKL